MTGQVIACFFIYETAVRCAMCAVIVNKQSARDPNDANTRNIYIAGKYMAR